MRVLPILNSDSYKQFHPQMYVDGMGLLCSNMTPRSFKRLGNDKAVWFGLQYYIKEYLIDQWGNHFFKAPLDDVLAEYKRFHKHFSRIDITVDHIVALHDLGYLPIRIKALPEGTLVPARVPFYTITSTQWGFGWLVNFLETQMSMSIWDFTTNATIAKMYYDLLMKWAKKTGDESFVKWQGHDFSMRGRTSLETSYNQAGHLLSFYGTDTIPAVLFLENYYNANMENELIGGSVPATEHSVASTCILANMEELSHIEDEQERREEAELLSIVRLLDKFPTGIVSYVSDTYDLWAVCSKILPRIKDKIMARDGKLVIRPDSGEPVDILCGDDIKEFGPYEEYDIEYYLKELIDANTPHGRYGGDITRLVKIDGKLMSATLRPQWNRYDKQFYYMDGAELELAPAEYTPANKGVIELLWDTFGGTINEKGYKVLDPHIGVIYGDAITQDRADRICDRLEKKGFASTNDVLGIGSYTYNYNTRDTLGTAVKSTYCEVESDGKIRKIELFKDPITDDGTKKSLKGLLMVYEEDGIIKVKDQCTEEEEKQGLLVPVFENGKLLVDHTLAEIRARVANG
jgi:nicotinamide phosphoribosyltransferase